ncbi:MAG: hypothetical protein HY958_02520 [Bacteroidia bacterium]|nr:hypothetical protein [Bacteroidia bacterium]
MCIILIFLSWCALSCENPSKAKNSDNAANDSAKVRKDTLKKIKHEILVTIDTLKDDMACIISAMPARKYYKKIEKEKFWPQYQKIVNEDWNMVSHYKVKPIKKWTDSLQLSISKDTNTLFYPFAGADFLYANSFFPYAKNYILVGLEPVGKFQNFDTMSSANIQRYFTKIENSLFYSNKVGFFRTRSMSYELNQIDLNGTIHLLTFYIKRCGYRMLGINYISLDTLGKVKEYDKKENIRPYAIKIDFCDSARIRRQSLYYFSYNIADQNLKNHKSLLLFAKNIGRQNTFLKAASYLMHGSGFSIIRQYILDNSEVVLQDDSGIPYKNFDASNWDNKLFGHYSKTIKLFSNKYQTDLKEAIDKSPHKGKIPFRIGYNIHHNEVNLLYAKKKHTDTL